MSMTQDTQTRAHTPGPWTSSLDVYAREDGASQIKGGNYKICVLPLFTAEYQPTADANVRLMCAAPDLLAALEALVSVWEGPRDRAALAFADAVNGARAAIDKARGRK